MLDREREFEFWINGYIYLLYLFEKCNCWHSFVLSVGGIGYEIELINFDLKWAFCVELSIILLIERQIVGLN